MKQNRKKSTKKLPRITLIYCFALGLSLPTYATTLAEAVQIAVDTHPSIKATRMSRNIIKDAFRVAQAAAKPRVSLRITGGYEYSDNLATRNRPKRGGHSGHLELWRNEAALTLSQLIFDGFATSHHIRSATIRYQGSGYELADHAEQLGIRATETFLEMLRHKHRVELSNKNVAAHTKMLGLASFRAKAGGGTTADVQQTQARLDLAKSTELEFDGAIRNAKARYIEVFGDLPADELIMPDAPVKALPTEKTLAIQIALQKSPAYQAASSAVLAAQTEIDASRGAYYPQVTFELSSSRTESVDGTRGIGTDAMAQFVVDYTLYDGGNRGAQYRQARATMYESKFRLQETRRLIEEEVRISFNAYLTSGLRLPVLEGNVETSKQVLNSYQSQFELAKRSLLDLLDAQNELFQARIALNDAKFAYLFAHFQLLGGTGQLLQHFGVTIDANEVDLETVDKTLSTNSPTTNKDYVQATSKIIAKTTKGSVVPTSSDAIIDVPGISMASVIVESDNTGQMGDFTPAANTATRQPHKLTSSLVNKGDRIIHQRAKEPEKIWAVQINAFHSEGSAKQLISKLRASGYFAYRVDRKKMNRRWHLVLIGRFPDVSSALAARKSFIDKEKSDAFVTPLYANEIIERDPI